MSSTKKQQNLNNDPSPGSPAFKSAQALGRAVSRANRALGTALPHTLKRKRAVVQRLSQRFQIECDTSFDEVTTPTIARRISDETVDLVKTFYEHDDIGCQAPGRKDVVIIRSPDGAKRKIQARHLNMSINEVYALFTDTNPTINIGKSKFAELRPKHVLLSSQLPCNVCLCLYHENFIMAVNSLHKVSHIFPEYDHHLPKNSSVSLPQKNVGSMNVPTVKMQRCSEICSALRRQMSLLGMFGKKMLMVNCARW